jgi:glycosyltransferase involved in cell wall biosynthesis
MTARPSVVHVIPDMMGGALTVVANLLAHRTPDAFAYRVVLTRNRAQQETRSALVPAADSCISFEHSLPNENLSAVVRRLAAALGPGPGVLVCHDQLELLLAASRPIDRTVIQVVHGNYDYYYDLAADHEQYIHGFAAISRTIYERLLERLPHRRDSIFWMPYGVPTTAVNRVAGGRTLRLVFVGRIDEAKGVFDLPEIDRVLRLRGVATRWTVVGDGPAHASLRGQWSDPHVKWTVAESPAAVRELLVDQDVLVLPSRAEGLSVAAIEAMSAGVVPVVSDLPSMREIVNGGTTALAAAVGDTEGFADAIASLARDRDRLQTIGGAAAACVRERYDITARAAAYQDLFARWRELRAALPAAAPRSIGSRLDRPWIPNPIVQLVRQAIRKAR